MPKGSEELTNKRRTEIIAACKKLYETMSFKEVSIKEIGSVTTFTRTSIYNYFRTKEEIFLAILCEEYEELNRELEREAESSAPLSRGELAEILAQAFSRRGLLLKILSMNMYDIEKISRLEKLVEFKQQYGRCLTLVEDCLKRLVPQPDEGERRDFIYSFFPFVFGIYPYTSVTEKQREAMAIAGIPLNEISIYEITLNAAKRLLCGGNGLNDA